MNFNASPVGLYDYPTPSAPRWFIVRKAILEHRRDDRAPLALSPNDSKGDV